MWVRRLIKREYQEDIDSSDALVDSSDEDTSSGDSEFCVRLFFVFFHLLAVGFGAGMEWFHPVHALQTSLHISFSITKLLHFDP